MTKYTCDKCEFDVIGHKLTFCPRCGSQFGTVIETTKMITTADGESVMTIDRKAFAHVEVGNLEKYSSEWYSSQMRDPSSPYYIPAGAVMYEDEKTGMSITHQESVIVPAQTPIVEIESPEIPSDTVREEDVDSYARETVEYLGGERKIKSIKLVEDATELKGEPKKEEPVVKEVKQKNPPKAKTVKPKFSEIVNMDISLEDKSALAKKHGYADSTIQRWLQKVAKEQRTTESQKG